MKLNTKPDWSTPIRSKLRRWAQLLLLFAAGAASAFADSRLQSDEHFESNSRLETENPEAVADNGFCLFPETYIPVSDTVKDALYGTSKSVILGVTLGYFLTVNTAPYSTSSNAVYDFFGSQCHRLPSRTLKAPNGNFYPVCARCQGMYIGYFLGNFDFLIWDAFQISNWQRWQKSLLHIGSYAALFLPLIIDGTVQYYSFDYESNNAWRMTTGILFGYALTAIIDEMIRLILDYPGVYRKNRLVDPVSE